MPFAWAMLMSTALLSAAAVAPATLVDHPIVSGLAPLYLDGEGWTASNHGGPQVGYMSMSNHNMPAVRWCASL